VIDTVPGTVEGGPPVPVPAAVVGILTARVGDGDPSLPETPVLQLAPVILALEQTQFRATEVPPPEADKTAFGVAQLAVPAHAWQSKFSQKAPLDPGWHTQVGPTLAPALAAAGAQSPAFWQGLGLHVAAGIGPQV